MQGTRTKNEDFVEELRSLPGIDSAQDVLSSSSDPAREEARPDLKDFLVQPGLSLSLSLPI